jgi:hypothetical protein
MRLLVSSGTTSATVPNATGVEIFGQVRHRNTAGFSQPFHAAARVTSMIKRHTWPSDLDGNSQSAGWINNRLGGGQSVSSANGDR